MSSSCFALLERVKRRKSEIVIWWAYMTAPTGAVPAKIASSPMAKMSMNHTKPVVVAGGIQKAATIAMKPTTALMPAGQHTIRQTLGGSGVCLGGGGGGVSDKPKKTKPMFHLEQLLPSRLFLCGVQNSALSGCRLGLAGDSSIGTRATHN